MEKSKTLIVLRIALVVLMGMTVAFGIFILPVMAIQCREEFPRFASLYRPILILTEILLIMFLLGLGTIVRMSVYYARGENFGVKFEQGLHRLGFLSYSASAMLLMIMLILYTEKVASPVFIALLGMTIVCGVLGMVFFLLKQMFRKGRLYKEDSEATI